MREQLPGRQKMAINVTFIFLRILGGRKNKKSKDRPISEKYKKIKYQNRTYDYMQLFPQ